MYQLKSVLIISLVCLLFISCSTNQQTDELPGSTPEAEGVSSEAILKFIEAIEASDHEIHSFVFLRHGKVIAEGWWNPYQPDLKHSLYSLSKNFTSTAVGFAITEKLFSLEDKVISFFPEELPDTISPYLSELTVENLLTMSVGQDPASRISRDESNWVQAFLSLPIVVEPGSRFRYNSHATYMLSAIIQKVTGERIVDFLTPRLFKPLGIEDFAWETCPKGINTGGWGLSLKTEDLAKTGQFYLQKGIWDGIQLLPEEWIKEASTTKIELAPELVPVPKDSSDWLQGYCYQFWRCRHNAYRGDGAYGQFLIIMPDQDAVIAITAETRDTQGEINLIWDNLLPGITEGKLPANYEATERLKQKLSTLTLPVEDKNITSSVVNNISGKKYVFEPNGKKMENISFNFQKNLCHVSFMIDTSVYEISFAEDKWQNDEVLLPGPNLANSKSTEKLPTKVAGNYSWTDDNTLKLTLRYIETPHSEITTCSFDKNTVSVAIKYSVNRNRSIPEFKGKFEE
jgi:CubicO group peptidase (beta-lactamase class C family)